MPKTFQDAVILTRKLGYQYLWIDALCIVQDDLEEWQQQAPMMASVYHNSVCTIAAHSARNDSEGFLAAAFERVPSVMLRRRLLYGANPSIPQFRNLYLGGSFKDQVNESFLNQRGWVFQERILSRRILHFTRHHVFFEDGFVVRTVDAGLSRTPLTHSPREDTKFMIEDIVATSADWYSLVERYSTCALTFDRDRLPAIAGIAAFVQTYDPRDKYLFGIWRNSLQQELLWVAGDKSPQEIYYGSDPSPPSWSWARWKGSIRFLLQIALCQPLFQLMDDSIHFDNAHSSVNLAKKSYFLSIRAEVLDLQDVAATVISRPAGQFSFEPPMHGLYKINSKKLGIVNWMAFDGARESKLLFPYLSCVFVSLYLYTRWMYDEEVEDPVARHTRVSYFLILVKTDQNSECYRRIGIGAKYGQRPQFDDLMTKTIQIE